MTQVIEKPEAAEPQTEILLGEVATVNKSGKIVGQIVGFAEADKAIARLDRYRGAIFNIQTEDGLKAAKSARFACARVRGDIERYRKAMTTPIDALKKALMAEEKNRVALVTKIEQPIADAIETEEKRQAEIERIAAEERQRIEATIASIRTAPGRFMLASAGQIAEEIERIEALDREQFCGRRAEAGTVIREICGVLREKRQAVLDAAADAAIAEEKLRASAAEADQLRAENERLRAAMAPASLPAVRLSDAQVKPIIDELESFRRESDMPHHAPVEFSAVLADAPDGDECVICAVEGLGYSAPIGDGMPSAHASIVAEWLTANLNELVIHLVARGLVMVVE